MRWAVVNEPDLGASQTKWTEVAISAGFMRFTPSPVIFPEIIDPLTHAATAQAVKLETTSGTRRFVGHFQ